MRLASLRLQDFEASSCFIRNLVTREWYHTTNLKKNSSLLVKGVMTMNEGLKLGWRIRSRGYHQL
jgi:hypothetical protein